MRRCLQCGAENLELARFCSSCGNPVVKMQPFSAPQPAATLPESPFVAVSRNQPQISPQQFAPAYVPFVPYPYAGPPPVVSPPKKRRRTLLFACLGIVAVLVLAVVGAFLFLSANGQPQLSVIQGQPIPGQQILLQGEHFPKGSKISVVVDTGLLVSSQNRNLLLIETAFIPVSYTEASGVIYRATVGDDGKFTLKIRVPRTWKSGSQHSIVAQILGTDVKQVKSVQYLMTIAS